jgi:hypothetical protein
MDFYNFIKEQPNVLKEIPLSKKYDKDIGSVCPAPSYQ